MAGSSSDEEETLTPEECGEISSPTINADRLATHHNWTGINSMSFSRPDQVNRGIRWERF